MSTQYLRPSSLRHRETHYCPGCGHGILHRIVSEVIDELDIRRTTAAVAPVGCAVVAYNYWNFDCSEAAHGRALAVATGIKRVSPDLCVFTYQGDGDLASIGLAETVHAANRGERLTCIFVNNACYGMTGGQMAPTSLIGQKTATTPCGRTPDTGEGWPLKISDLLAQLPGVCFVARCALSSPKEIQDTARQIKTAFQHQLDKRGFSLVEVLSPCPTIWQKNPVEAMAWIDTEMKKVFPPGILKTP
ncbi:MAG: 2-oxoglutarate oxidoreductase [Candidatus Omnitrophica bacterium]|nr:2-oxoglutarate oxidoreductase [Candidatus Omnitrophota bacterium]